MWHDLTLELQCIEEIINMLVKIEEGWGITCWWLVKKFVNTYHYIQLHPPLQYPSSYKTMVVCNECSSWWRHQMETFSALLAICAGNSPVPGEFPTQWPVTRSLMFSLICARTNGWANNGEAGDLRRNHAHYDVTVMFIVIYGITDFCF